MVKFIIYLARTLRCLALVKTKRIIVRFNGTLNLYQPKILLLVV